MSSKIYGLIEKMVSRASSVVTKFNGVPANKKGLIAYYPENLLINSNFSKPINQREITKCDYPNTGSVKVIDCWSFVNEGFELVYPDDENFESYVEINDGFLSFRNGNKRGLSLKQSVIVGPDNYGEKFTFAVKDTDGAIHTLSGAVGANSFIDGDGLTILAGRFVDEASATIDVYLWRPGDYVWAGLYKGEYTAELLPKDNMDNEWRDLVYCQQRYRRKEYGILYCTGISDTELMISMNLGSVPLNSNPYMAKVLPIDPDETSTGFYYYNDKVPTINLREGSPFAEVVDYVEESTTLSLKLTLATANSNIVNRVGYLKNMYIEVGY